MTFCPSQLPPFERWENRPREPPNVTALLRGRAIRRRHVLPPSLVGGLPPRCHPGKCWVLHSESGPSSCSCKITSSVGQVSVDRDSSSCALRAGLQRRLCGQVGAMPPSLELIRSLNRENLPNTPISASGTPKPSLSHRPLPTFQ